MSEVVTPVPPVKKRNLRAIRNGMIATVTVAALAVGGVLLYQFVTKQEEVSSEIQSQMVSFGSIQSKVTGSGNASAKESAAITLTAGGTVQDVLVAAGDFVTAGQPLYSIYSKDAQEQVTLAQEQINSLLEDMDALQTDAANLVTCAPFSGKLIDVKEFPIDQEVSKGTEVATLVNDKTLKLSLYFSYAYENDISVGQPVLVSIPAVMGSFQGKVEKINPVSYISPEGAVHFEVVVVFENPGTLTADMTASASLTAEDGVEIYPYEASKTEYYETRVITTKASGPVSSVGTLMNYANVSAGAPLLTLGSSTIDRDIRAKQKEIDEAQLKLNESQKALENFNAVSPIDGTVVTCTLVKGTEVKSGDTVITISNTSNMVVEITVDDRNIAFVQPGMVVELNDWNGGVHMGTVTAIKMGSATSSNGMTSYPVTLAVDNADNSLISGMWLDYSFVASQSDDCLMVPMQSVKYVSDAEGETYSVVFIRADSEPENMVELDIPQAMPGEIPQYPSPSDGYYPIPVETGLSDNYNVEIKSGLTGEEEVFVNFYVTQAYG